MQFFLIIFSFCSFKFTLPILVYKCWYNNKIDMTIKNHNHVSQLEEKLLAYYSFCNIYSSFSEHLINKILSYPENIY